MVELTVFTKWYLIMFYVINGTSGTYEVNQTFMNQKECLTYAEVKLTQMEYQAYTQGIPEVYFNGVCIKREFNSIGKL